MVDRSVNVQQNSSKLAPKYRFLLRSKTVKISNFGVSTRCTLINIIQVNIVFKEYRNNFSCSYMQFNQDNYDKRVLCTYEVRIICFRDSTERKTEIRKLKECSCVRRQENRQEDQQAGNRI